MNGATCIDLVNDFQCRCVSGFQGALCQENVNDCAMLPCANGGTCHDLINDYLCDCPPGFGGKDCSHNINECSAMPCQHGATCEDLHNDYKCTCKSGYQGKNCELFKNQTDNPIVVSSTPSKGTETSTAAQPHMSPDALNDNKSVMQTVLYVCVGIGVPCLVIVCILLIFCCIKHRRNLLREDHSVHKDNERNERMNNKVRNKIKNLESGDTSPQNVKITNEEQSSSRTLNINKNNLNLNKDCNKLYQKDLVNTRHSPHSSSKILDCNKLLSSGCSQTPILPTLESTRDNR
jgi:hypothetical protein